MNLYPALTADGTGPGRLHTELWAHLAAQSSLLSGSLVEFVPDDERRLEPNSPEAFLMRSAWEPAARRLTSICPERVILCLAGTSSHKNEAVSGREPNAMSAGTELKHFRADKGEHLLGTQEAAVRLVLRNLLDIAIELPGPQTRPPGTPGADDLPNADSGFNRPHHVFTIDGARGAGKTYALLTLAHAVEQISAHWRKNPENVGSEGKWLQFARKDTAKAKVAPEPKSRDAFSEVACIIRIIFPSDLERQETVMERIFVSMKHKLDEEIKEREKNPGRIGATGQPDKMKQLREDLVHEIVPGWHFSKVEGREVIVRDAIDYADYSDLYEVEAEKSVRRIEKWRRFLDDFLDQFRTAVLMVFLDDSDVHPDVTEDILQTARMFLNHPRVVTVLAGNIRSMRSLLLHKAMRQLGQSMRALSDPSVQTAADWRRIERRGVEDYLEKVLPHSQRIFIQATSGEDQNNDFKKVADISLNELCRWMMHGTRTQFLSDKFRLAISHARQEIDRPTPRQRRHLEDYLSWWLFLNHYREALMPRSARQIRTIKDYYLATADGNRLDAENGAGQPPSAAKDGDDDRDRRSTGRRLIMALFENPANFSLIQQFNDSDINVATWLQDQYTDSEWVGPRRFHVNGRALDRGQFGYDYVRFRLDLGLAMPMRQNAEEAIPLNLLPVPHGRTHLRRFFHPQRMARRYRRLGLCQWIDHAVIPGNCIYFYDLDALPDRSLLHGKSGERRLNRSTHVHDAKDGVAQQGLGQGYWET
jgi:hypothetical protein